MKLARIEIRHFRNHEHTAFDCADGLNALIGNNGEGKTNIVEAVSYLCLSKSFYASGDTVVLQIGRDGFDVRGEFVADNGVQRGVRVQYDSRSAAKTMTVNTSPVETFSSIIGEFPVVVLSPEQSGITFGAPSERRKFMDLVMSQSSRIYLDQLMEFRRILRQRNRVLLQAKLTGRDAPDALEPWNESLVRSGTQLVIRRNTFVREFLPHVAEAYRRLAGENEKPFVGYEPSVGGAEPGDGESVGRTFRSELERHRDEERRTGATVVGPHRDELDFRVNDLALRKFASQGQHKTFLIALKLAEFFYLKAQRGETPVLLLDDVFSELDDRRSRRLLELVQPLGQVFVTTTDERVFGTKPAWSGTNRKLRVREGRLVHEEALRVAHQAAP